MVRVSPPPIDHIKSWVMGGDASSMDLRKQQEMERKQEYALELQAQIRQAQERRRIEHMQRHSAHSWAPVAAAYAGASSAAAEAAPPPLGAPLHHQPGAAPSPHRVQPATGMPPPALQMLPADHWSGEGGTATNFSAGDIHHAPGMPSGSSTGGQAPHPQQPSHHHALAPHVSYPGGGSPPASRWAHAGGAATAAAASASPWHTWQPSAPGMPPAPWPSANPALVDSQQPAGGILGRQWPPPAHHAPNAAWDPGHMQQQPWPGAGAAARGQAAASEPEVAQRAREAARRAAYRSELEAQVRDKAARKAAERQQRLREDRHKEAEAAQFDPWGRGGAGAPLRNEAGQVVADWRSVRMVHQRRHDPAAAAAVGCGSAASSPAASPSPHHPTTGGWHQPEGWQQQQPPAQPPLQRSGSHSADSMHGHALPADSPGAGVHASSSQLPARFPSPDDQLGGQRSFPAGSPPAAAAAQQQQQWGPERAHVAAGALADAGGAAAHASGRAAPAAARPADALQPAVGSVVAPGDAPVVINFRSDHAFLTPKEVQASLAKQQTLQADLNAQILEKQRLKALEHWRLQQEAAQDADRLARQQAQLAEHFQAEQAREKLAREAKADITNKVADAWLQAKRSSNRQSHLDSLHGNIAEQPGGSASLSGSQGVAHSRQHGDDSADRKPTAPPMAAAAQHREQGTHTGGAPVAAAYQQEASSYASEAAGVAAAEAATAVQRSAVQELRLLREELSREASQLREAVAVQNTEIAALRAAAAASSAAQARFDESRLELARREEQAQRHQQEALAAIMADAAYGTSASTRLPVFPLTSPACDPAAAAAAHQSLGVGQVAAPFFGAGGLAARSFSPMAECWLGNVAHSGSAAAHGAEGRCAPVPAQLDLRASLMASDSTFIFPAGCPPQQPAPQQAAHQQEAAGEAAGSGGGFTGGGGVGAGRLPAAAGTEAVARDVLQAARRSTLGGYAPGVEGAPAAAAAVGAALATSASTELADTQRRNEGKLSVLSGITTAEALDDFLLELAARVPLPDRANHSDGHAADAPAGGTGVIRSGVPQEGQASPRRQSAMESLQVHLGDASMTGDSQWFSNVL